MKELKADAYLENWVDKERERVVKKIQREERRLFPLDLVTRKEAASILGCSPRHFDRIIKGHYLERYYFLSRPRRFGKSLLMSTIHSYFSGRRESEEIIAAVCAPESRPY